MEIYNENFYDLLAPEDKVRLALYVTLYRY
jgi:hypothetical protein